MKKMKSFYDTIKRDLALKGIAFAYPAKQEEVLRKLNLIIGVNTTIGLIDSTGSGKMTLVDIYSWVTSTPWWHFYGGWYSNY